MLYFFKHKTTYDMLISDWNSDVCSSDLRAVTEDHMHALRRGALFPCEDVCIDAHLDQVLRLRRARQLGIGDLVGEGAEPRRLRHFEQDIRIALPGPVQEGALVDNITSFAERGAGPRGLLLHARVARDPDHRPPLRLPVGGCVPPVR